MNFRPCLLIPIYNHRGAVANTVSRLTPYDLPIFIVDDGSDDATREVLREIAARQPLVRLFHLPRNAGKGAAVMHGFRQAYAAGHTHALQIDADGQHDAADVRLFLECGAARPDAVICGKPIYAEDAPKSRRYGRYLTHVWVWFETLSFAIGDSLCGFRLYPLVRTCALIDSTAIRTRMDFDIDIIVRLAWRGLSVENIPTRVSYPADGVSHFDMMRDNVRISVTHTRLVFGMLARLPLLIWRRTLSRAQPARHWSRLAERGNALGLRVLSSGYGLFGESAARLLLYPVVAWFFISNHTARTASLDYLKRVSAHKQTPSPTLRDSFRHMLAFAQSALDKLGAWLGRVNSGKLVFPNQQGFDELVNSKRGAIVVGSHLGNLEMMRALAVGRGMKSVNAVVYTDHARRFNAALSAASRDFGVNLFQVSSLGPDTAITLSEKIERGEVLVIVGDRTPPAENGRVTQVDFLGKPALFPQGPWILASLLRCPVYVFFCLQQGDRYHVHFDKFDECIDLPRRDREHHLRSIVQRYAGLLEMHCVEAPYQWFNFFDFWSAPPASSMDSKA